MIPCCISIHKFRTSVCELNRLRQKLIPSLHRCSRSTKIFTPELANSIQSYEPCLPTDTMVQNLTKKKGKSGAEKLNLLILNLKNRDLPFSPLHLLSLPSVQLIILLPLCFLLLNSMTLPSYLVWLILFSETIFCHHHLNLNPNLDHSLDLPLFILPHWPSLANHLLFLHQHHHQLLS